MRSPSSADPILEALPAVDASTVKNQFSAVARQAAAGAVAIRRHRRPEWVLVPAEEYVRLEKLRRAPLEALGGQFDDLVAQMQTARSHKAVQGLFRAGSGALGKAAVKSAKAHGR